MKEIYTAPEMEIISFAAEDVITASTIDPQQTTPLGIDDPQIEPLG